MQLEGFVQKHNKTRVISLKSVSLTMYNSRTNLSRVINKSNVYVLRGRKRKSFF